jgi:squalene-hopene/tetraprenyl-beta-curcumene cyclase
VLRAGEWLRSIQNADGGWGEGGSTPSQTAWAILGLLAGGDDASLSVNKAIEYLVNSQRVDGTWHDVPNAVYPNSPLYPSSFALLALASFLKTRREVAQG